MRIAVAVFCDTEGCDNRVPASGVQETDKFVALEALPEGWVVRDGQHLCPAHAVEGE